MLQPSLIKEWNWSRKSFWTKLIILANAGGQLGKYIFFFLLVLETGSEMLLCYYRELVVKSIEDRFSVDESGQIIEFNNGGCPWKEHFFQLEKKMGLDVGDKKILYSIYPDSNGSWRIQGVPVSSHSFELRKALPDQWRGLRDKELDQMSGIDGCVFIHASGFIGGHSTRAGALEMGRKALAIN
jgi:uncharacterized UPF0160 family protein